MLTRTGALWPPPSPPLLRIASLQQQPLCRHTDSIAAYLPRRKHPAHTHTHSKFMWQSLWSARCRRRLIWTVRVALPLEQSHGWQGTDEIFRRGCLAQLREGGGHRAAPAPGLSADAYANRGRRAGALQPQHLPLAVPLSQHTVLQSTLLSDVAAARA